MSSRFDTAFAALPLVAILRGVTRGEVLSIGQALYEAGFRVIEVPLNSPDALESISLLVHALPKDVVVGAGTVLSAAAVDDVKRAGGELIVMPHADVRVIQHAKSSGLVCVPGATTPTEAFACVDAGADAVKLFPAEMVSPGVIKAIRAVLPATLRLLPVGGITPDNMGIFVQAGASGFGLGSALYRPGADAETVGQAGRRFSLGWQQLLKR